VSSATLYVSTMMSSWVVNVGFSARISESSVCDGPNSMMASSLMLRHKLLSDFSNRFHGIASKPGHKHIGSVGGRVVEAEGRRGSEHAE
jgi:hypothetical protein